MAETLPAAWRPVSGIMHQDVRQALQHRADGAMDAMDNSGYNSRASHAVQVWGADGASHLRGPETAFTCAPEMSRAEPRHGTMALQIPMAPCIP